MSTPFRLLLPRPLYDEMIAQARAELPNECCGLLAGTVFKPNPPRLLLRLILFLLRLLAGQLFGPALYPAIGLVYRRYALVNEAASPTEYLSEPRSMFKAVRDMSQLGLDILAVYHSHPDSVPVPSHTDRERNYSPDVVHLIISLKGAEPVVRAWWLTAEDYREADWVLTDLSEEFVQ